MPIDCNAKYERGKNVEVEHGTDTSAVRKIKTAAVMAAEKYNLNREHAFMIQC